MKEIEIEPKVYKELKHSARERGITPQQYADQLLEKVKGLQSPVWFKQADIHMVCPYCEKDFHVLINMQIITQEAYQAKIKREVEELKARALALKVPENSLALLKEKNFFGKTKEQWLLQAVSQGIVSELDDLATRDLKEVRRLEKKYHLAPNEHKAKEGVKDASSN